jgi:hypothetical protein
MHQVLAGRPSHVATESSFHRLPASDSLLPPPRERAREANPGEVAKWGRPAREFGKAFCLFRLEQGITKHECMKARKKSSMME